MNGCQVKRRRDGPIHFTDSRLHFIHGILEGHGGTCHTLPVLYVGLGRRLGYPLKLVQAMEHLFVRWDDPQTGARLNLEATSPGLNCHPDEYYRTWPKPVRSDFVAKGWLLKSLTRQEELALFYKVRGQCLLDWADFGQG